MIWSRRGGSSYELTKLGDESVGCIDHLYNTITSVTHHLTYVTSSAGFQGHSEVRAHTSVPTSDYHYRSPYLSFSCPSSIHLFPLSQQHGACSGKHSTATPVTPTTPFSQDKTHSHRQGQKQSQKSNIFSTCAAKTRTLQDDTPGKTSYSYCRPSSGCSSTAPTKCALIDCAYSGFRTGTDKR